MNAKIKLTGLWKETSKDGQEYLSGGMVPGAKLLIFQNKFKSKPSDPDYIAYLAPKKDNGGDNDVDGF